MRYIITMLAVFMFGCGVQTDTSTPSSSVRKAPDHVYVRVPISLLTPDFVKGSGFDRDSKHDDEFAFGYIKFPAFERIPLSVTEQMVVLDEDAWRHHNYDPKTLKMRPEKMRIFGEGDDLIKDDYHNYVQLKAELERLAKEFPSLAQVGSAGKSVQGRELLYIKISDNVTANEDEPNLVYIANMHGDEVIGRELLIYFARLLLNDYSSNARIKNLVNNAQIFLMPSMNPDGFEAQRRGNANGDDLNRSFPDFTSDPNDTTNGRPRETGVIMDWHKQNLFHIALNFHGGEVCINLPWDTQENSPDSQKFGDDPVMYKLSREYADTNRTMYDAGFDHGLTYGYEWYEVDGGMQDWASYYRNSIHATVELGGKWPSASSLAGHWNDNREALLKYFEGGLMGIHLKVVNQRGEPISSATVSVNTANRDIKYVTSNLHRVTIPGKQVVTVKAPNYEAKNVTLDATSFNGSFETVVLK